MKVTIEFPDDFINSLVTKEWLEAKLKELGTVTPKPEEPKPEPLKKCKAGPEIKWIKVSNDKKQLQVNFWGQDVTQIKYTLKKGDSLVQDGIFNPTNDKPFINLNKVLTEGVYTLKFEGTLCSGEDTKSFEIKSTSTPPPDPGTNDKGLETAFYYNK